VIRVTLYSRPGCHLCNDLKADLVEIQQEVDFVLVERNIDDHPEDFARFQYLIPVLDIDGGPLLYPPHHWDVVYAALRLAAAHHDQ
jgi:glutaredoxin